MIDKTAKEINAVCNHQYTLQGRLSILYPDSKIERQLTVIDGHNRQHLNILNESFAFDIVALVFWHTNYYDIKNRNETIP